MVMTIYVVRVCCYQFNDNIRQRRANDHILQNRSRVRTLVRSHTNVPLYNTYLFIY